MRLREAQRAVDAVSTRLRSHATRPTARLTPVKVLAFPTRNPRPLTPDFQLADIYGWFTEGFDTRDLQETTTLLQKPNIDTRHYRAFLQGGTYGQAGR